MWNYSFTFPSALMLLILAGYYFRRPRLPLQMNRTFLTLLCIDAMTLLTDYVSTRLDENWTEFSIEAGYTMNLAFFVFYLARIYWFFLFYLDVLENHVSLPRWVRRLSPAVFVLSELVALSSPLTHAVFSFDAEGYHSGPLYQVLYVCFFFYLIAAAALLLRYRRSLPTPVGAGLSGINGILIIGNIFRMLLPQLLVMNTFCLMAILVIYLSFENPDLFLSNRGSAFNTRGFEFLQREWAGRKNYRVLAFIIRGYSETRGIYGGMQMDRGIGQINDFLAESFPDCLNFYLRNGSFAVVGSEKTDCRAMCETITRRFQQPWEALGTEMMMKPAFVEVRIEAGSPMTDRINSVLWLALDSAGAAEYAEDSSVPGSINAVDRYLEERRAMDAALERGGLEVYLQPLVECGSGRMVAAEALARLRGEDGRLIPPAEFIPLAEKDGSIIALGEEVLRKTCLFIRDHDMEKLGLRWINVNLSPCQCMSGDLAEHFAVILKETGVPAERIHLELTEQSIIDYSLLKNQITALQELGFQFALDDYGSGYSNLTRVKQYPFKNIKMDMEVVRNYFRDRDPLLPTLIGVFKQMQFSITAEGIETEEMAKLMSDVGCDYLQGYYFSKPIPMDEFLARYLPLT